MQALRRSVRLIFVAAIGVHFIPAQSGPAENSNVLFRFHCLRNNRRFIIFARRFENGKTFISADRFAKLADVGFSDLWGQYNPGSTEWTRYSRRTGGVRGNGFRVDHAFAPPPLARRVTSCRCSYREREAGISDHSLLQLEVAD